MTPICSSSHGSDLITDFCCLNDCIFIEEEKLLSSLRFTDVSNPTEMKQFAQRTSSKTAVPPLSDEDPNQLLLLRNHDFYLFASYPAPELGLVYFQQKIIINGSPVVG